MFHMIKDKILLYRDFKDLDLECLICKQKDHLSLNCPKVHYFVDKEQVIRNYLNDEKIFERMFERNWER